MHQRHICSKCQHNHLLAIAFVPDRSGEADSVGRLSIASIFVGKGWFGSERFSTAGELSALVCKRCGYAELYVASPESIPVDGDYVREVIGPEPAGPSR
jgi:hypothetical protein